MSDRISAVAASLIASVRGKQKYGLIITYTVPNAGVRRKEPCLYFDLELSLVPTLELFKISNLVSVSYPLLAVGVPDLINRHCCDGACCSCRWWGRLATLTIRLHFPPPVFRLRS